MLIGFGAGLALDMAPPASNLLGLSALVFCLVGYGCGLLRGPLERSAWLPLAAVVLGVTAGEALYALVGMTFGDPDITWQSVRLMLPVAVVYDILLCPFVMYAVARFGGYGGWAAAGTRAPEPLAGRGRAGAADRAPGQPPPAEPAGPQRRRGFRRRDGAGPRRPAGPGPAGAPAARRAAARRRGPGRLAAQPGRRRPDRPDRQPRPGVPDAGGRVPGVRWPGRWLPGRPV